MTPSVNLVRTDASRDARHVSQRRSRAARAACVALAATALAAALTAAITTGPYACQGQALSFQCKAVCTWASVASGGSPRVLCPRSAISSTSAANCWRCASHCTASRCRRWCSVASCCSPSSSTSVGNTACSAWGHVAADHCSTPSLAGVLCPAQPDSSSVASRAVAVHARRSQAAASVRANDRVRRGSTAAEGRTVGAKGAKGAKGTRGARAERDGRSFMAPCYAVAT